MADTTLLLDDPMSSPDPLADEIRSSVQSKARRIAMPHHDYSMGAARSSSPLKSPTKSSTKGRSMSPRKRTFELDVGNEATPQRILVTVEADETIRPGINRRLFPPSSPTRKVVRAEETMTRKVPLRGLSDDEGLGDDAATPRKRGRPRKSNGTPVPKARKRAGTPLKPTVDATRPRLDLQSDASMFSDISMINNEEIRGSTPKPKPRARKTPAKRAPTPSAAIPSSEIPPSKQTTGRKRGRPRKALMPEEVAEIAMAESELDLPEMVDDEPAPAAFETASVADDVRYSIEGLDVHSSDRATEPPIDDGIGIESDVPSRLSSKSVSPVPPELTILDPIFEESLAASGEPAEQQHQQNGEAEGDANSMDMPTSDGYAPLMEPEDDGYSDNGTVESANPARQDTLTHASDFSMIAVESLPSFQASYHGNLSRITEDLNEPAELGEATNMMINQTLETLRRSIQNDNSGGDSDEEGSKGDDEAPAARRDSSVGSSGGRQMRGPPVRNRTAWSSSPLGSPKRRKSLPLSRQMFVGKARQVDDSFSSLPDSILHAATPARFRTQQTEAETAHQEPEENQYEDSFSEIPDAVLEAATPAPTRTISRNIPSGLQSSPVAREDSPDRGAGSAQELNKLPTPDGTSSSNVDPQRSGPEDQGPSAQRMSNSFSQSRTQIPSSPPNIIVEHYESLVPRPESQKRDPHREIPESPQLASFSGAGQEESSRNLEAPTSARRPTLSPIVRVARTLQSVMSDKSSPEGLESNLGSPFRGSHSRQSSIAKSPTRFSNDLFGRSTTSQVPSAVGAAAQPPRESRPSLSQSIRSGSNRDAAHALNDPFGPHINGGQQSQPLKAQSTPPRRATPDRGSSVRSGLVTSSTKNLLPSDDQMSWGPDESPLRARSITRQSITRALRESSLAASQPRRPPQKSPLQLARDGERAPSRSTQLPRNLDDDSGDEILLDLDNDDIWEVEASRPEIQESTIAAATAAADQPSTGHPGGKIPDSWRNGVQNDAYQDERESPPQLLLDESPQKMPAAQQTQGEYEYEDEEEEEEEDNIEEVPRHIPVDEEEQLPSLSVLQQRKAPSVPPKRADGSDYSLLQDRSESARIPSERSLESVNVEEYSLVAPQIRQTGSAKNRVQPVATVEDEHSLVAPEGNARPVPTPARSRLFGGFDIMSFFSSPSAVPKEDVMGKAERVNATRGKSQATQPVPAAEKAQSSLWSAGLFPSIAQKEFRPSPERGNTLLSSSALPSSPNRSVESSPTPTPTPREAPSTPERQSYPAIEQKRDFTPRSGQNASTLFTGSAVNATRTNATRSSGSVAFLNVPDDRQDHDTSIATQESDYERVPPREIPSRWDKTLSPSKSSFRSPMKPTTPGRVVAFSRNVVLPPPPPPLARVPEHAETESVAPSRPQNNTSKHVFLHPPPALLQPPQIPDQYGQENDLRSKSAANTAASRSQPPRPGSAVAAVASVVSGPKAAQSNRFPQPKAFALTGNTWTKSHWVRFDEILQLRRKNPRQFRQDHPDASMPGHAADDPVYCSDENEGSNNDDTGPHPSSTRSSSRSKILGKQVSSQGESMLVEPWHLEVVSAFMQELNPCPWDERVLVKRLFALIVGEQRRKHASVRQSSARMRGQTDQRVELGTRHR